ncbi:uncharacterized protein LOC114866725 isoform X2 [Betta splendens]|uniref:Uncharacterized protein LOC114866725 isoform X2 n=1 Tax=Betta splendens TaxID=158456 RepID=A0A9W2XFI2_BETSP|nr:uncharacterized protein LOC114866725 isoform X2 [Betta splendens]
MASPVWMFCITALFLGKLVQLTDVTSSSLRRQTSHFVTVKAGDNLTLKCFNEHNGAAKIYWYKHSLGQKPTLISTFYKYDGNCLFYGEFINNPRFIMDNENDKNHLTITGVHTSDSATYYCMSCYIHSVEFLWTTTVVVMNSDLTMPALVHQSVSGSIQSGGSVTLNCTVQTGTCDGQHSVYWFKDSGEARPGIVYTNGDRNDQCERKPDTQTHTCVFDLPLQSLNASDAGTYYCAVASCGNIVFGNGTKLQFEVFTGNVDLLVAFLSGALIFFFILTVFLVVSLCKKRNFGQSTEHRARFSSIHTSNTEIGQDADNLHYAALNTKLPKRSRRQKDDTNTHYVYSSVKL